ncbi:MAG: type II toxin-antitoxin system RelE/ParE family toxin [bacterium]|nr:type II toxin-antitoxin system RelE/ParE family toxin [bacterium]
MNKIQKALQKFGESERIALKKIIVQIKSGNFSNLDIKKLKGHNNVFRVRKGKFRVVFSTDNGKTTLIAIGRRNDTTYNF